MSFSPRLALCLAACVPGAVLGARVRSAHGVHDAVRATDETPTPSKLGRLAAMRSHAAAVVEVGTGDFNCTEYPALCQEPFNCQDVTEEDERNWKQKGYAYKGHANPSSMCGDLRYAGFVELCVGKGDLVQAANRQYIDTAAGKFLPECNLEVDASYCFIEGHCTDTTVTANTTLEEMEKMCDERVGHERWTSFPTGPDDELLLTPSTVNGFVDSSETEAWILLACAMGYLHCDVIYCQENFCKDEYYVKKYGHFLLERGLEKSHS